MIMSLSTIGCYYYHAGKGLDWDPQDPIVQQWRRKLNEITGELINGVMHACGVVFNPITVYVISA